jgi:PAS domain S-box-containing protein
VGLRLTPFARFGLAVAFGALAISLRIIFIPIWGEELPYIFFFPAVMASAWLGGLWPGLVTTLLCAAATVTLWIIREVMVMSPWREGLGLVVFTGVGTAISVLNEAWRRAASIVADSEDRLRTTFGSIGDAVIATDEQGKVTRMNGVAEGLTGWSEAGALGRRLEDVFVIRNERTGLAAENPVQRVLREGIIAGLANHTVLVSKSGREIPIDDSAAPIRDADRRVRGVVLVFRDISEGRRIEHERAALLEAERAARAETERVVEELRQIQALTEVALFTVERDALMRELLQRVRVALRCDTASILLLDGAGQHFVPAASDGLEAPLGEYVRIPLGRGLAGRIAASDRVTIIDDLQKEDVFTPFLRENIRSLIGVRLEIGERLIGVLHAGTSLPRRFTEADGRVLSLASERVAFALEQARLHEEERAAGREALATAERLRRAEERFRLAIEAAPAAMLMVDAQGTILLANALTEMVLGHPREEIIGCSIEMLVPERFRSAHPGYRAGFLSDPHQRPMGAGRELYALRKDGSEVPVEIGLSPIDTAEGRFVLAAVTDITHRKRSEKALQDADRRKDEFLAMLAHELRNPLAAIANAALLLRQRGSSDGTARWAELIDRQTAHLARILDDLLDVSRISRGEITLRRGPMVLADAVALALETARPLLETRRHALETDLTAEPMWMEGDANRLAQVIANLLSNAARYTDEGGTVSLGVERDGSEAVIRVKDTGIGIPPEMLPRVFDLFVQGDRSLDRASGGLGLGLTLAKRLVELHGGRITASSEGVGRGSEFVVRLPLCAGPPSAERAAGPGLSHDSGGRRILLVDDNADSVEALADVLAEAGCQVRMALDGPSALRMAGEFAPDVVLLDIGLPGMDGYEVARRLRADPALRKVVLVALTGYSQPENRRIAKEAGFDHYLVKPIRFDTLLSLLGP